MKPGTPKLHECQHVLIVEGHSDLLFYAAFLHHLGALEGVFIQNFQGKNKILNRDLLGDFLNEKLLADKTSIGIIVDADSNPEGTSRSVRDHLKELTGREVSEGQWHEQKGDARLGFFVAPAPTVAGEVETLAWNALPNDGKHATMKQYVTDYLQGMTSEGWNAQSPDKARIGVYLAVAHDEDPRLGPGAREGKFDFDSPGYDRLRAFLEPLRQKT
jgi:hypothetical protein